jgi:hypothetical protein
MHKRRESKDVCVRARVSRLALSPRVSAEQGPNAVLHRLVYADREPRGCVTVAALSQRSSAVLGS